MSMPAAFTAFYNEEGRLDIHSWYGFDASASPDSLFLNADYTTGEEVVEIHDATHDSTYAGDTWVNTGGVRFFASVPITTVNGAHMGIFAVLDSEPRTLTSDQNRLMREFAALFSESIMLRLETSLVRKTASQIDKKRRHTDLRLDRIMTSFPLPMFIVDRQGSILNWNRVCVDRFGWTREESVGKSIYDLIVPEESNSRIDMLIGRVFNRRRILGISLSFIDQAGESVSVVARMFPLFDAEGRVESCVFIHSEPPAYRGMQREVLDLEKDCRELAEDLTRLKATFLDNMSHEFRTPLTSIIGFADILYDHVDDSSRHFTRLIENSAQQLMDTLTSILNLAQLRGHLLELHPEPLNLVDNANSLCDEFADQAAEKDLTIHVESELECAQVLVDPACHTRVMQNLLDNAIKYTRKGGVSIQICVEESHAVINVTDTGIGISKEFLPHIFDEFLQESRGLSRVYQGSGLGLAITKRLVELMGGSITIESRRGEGSTFSVRYPAMAE